MTRRRWVYVTKPDGTVESVEVGQEWQESGRDGGHKSEEEIYGKLQATDGTDISTRRRHREYMRANNLTVAEDFKGTWEQAKAERERYRRGDFSPQQREAVRESIAKAMYQTQSRGNRRGR